ncbi:MAG: alpha-ribazole-5-phosphate synthase [Clostridiales bacterium]|jgi:hypothetical protein|nr:alpha-ribazole-5-phosphate synthase [Clostridiales bacterium]
MRAWTRRDLTIVPDLEGGFLAIACDSCGGVGLKPGDVYPLSPYHAAKFTARVALMEVMCLGGLPIAIANGVACEMKPTGEETIRGIQDELKSAGIVDVVLTGSTEENFTTSMTALAITVVGAVQNGAMKCDRALAGDKFLLFGKPCVGSEVDLTSAGFYPQIRFLLSLPEVREIVPVGSKGVAYEAGMLAALNDMAFTPLQTGADIMKSAGPATCLITLCGDGCVSRIHAVYPSAEIIGVLSDPGGKHAENSALGFSKPPR